MPVSRKGPRACYPGRRDCQEGGFDLITLANLAETSRSPSDAAAADVTGAPGVIADQS